MVENKPHKPEIVMDAPTNKLMHDLETVVGDAEELLKATASQGGEHISRIRSRAEESLRMARERIKEVTQSAEAQARAAARELDKQVHENPWTAVGIAAGIGLVLGILLARK
jgi:ElaB/YqjD/DUF883 family membrane-anchored ribosome-binding protein